MDLTQIPMLSYLFVVVFVCEVVKWFKLKVGPKGRTSLGSSLRGNYSVKQVTISPFQNWHYFDQYSRRSLSQKFRNRYTHSTFHSLFTSNSLLLSSTQIILVDLKQYWRSKFTTSNIKIMLSIKIPSFILTNSQINWMHVHHLAIQ